MSASEKLSALDEAMQSGESPALGNALNTYCRALPQIRAVVEAAERYDDPQWPYPWERLTTAVAALDEALGDSVLT